MHPRVPLTEDTTAHISADLLFLSSSDCTLPTPYLYRASRGYLFIDTDGIGQDIEVLLLVIRIDGRAGLKEGLYQQLYTIRSHDP